MTETDATTRILAFAAHVGRGASHPPEAIARRRNWIDAAGRPTDEGRQLIDALQDQEATRTVFRGNF